MAQVNVYDNTTTESRQFAHGIDIPEADIPKKGHSCFGFGCDMRRAVIWVNLWNMLLSTIALVLGILYVHGDIQDFKYPGTSVITPGGTEHYSEGLLYGVVIGTYAVIMLFYSAGLLGALSFSKCLVITALLFYFIQPVMTIAGWIVAKEVILFQIPFLVLELLFIYPHFMLAKEINANIMTAKNYRFEKRGCCCV